MFDQVTSQRQFVLRDCRVMSRPAATDLHGDVHPRAKPVNDPHETVYRESAKICIPHPREISRSYARQAMRLPDTQAIPIERLDNFRGQDRLELLYIRILFTEIPKHIAATAYHFKLFLFHLNISFNRFRRSRIASSSR
jgi:hypothetical protein